MTARFLYARFPTAEQRAAVDWLHTVAEVASGYAGSATVRMPAVQPLPSGPVVAWRLVSDNRREIARGCRLFASERDAHADITPLLREVRSLVVHAAPGPRIRSTGWFVTRDGELAMMGARRYENRSTALNAGALALRLLAQLADAAAAGEDPVEPATPEYAV
ncbi:hypothetical protein [Microbacterium sp. CJ88]|uniref:hypothetical protein n=1 Tax=Microbacterium sp. CJ88 TaxID=3445672 RepID=UPI003F658F76